MGQYSSGKSNIISALTGRKDIKIDANVATDIVSEYLWNNIVLMDTPGILAGRKKMSFLLLPMICKRIHL